MPAPKKKAAPKKATEQPVEQSAEPQVEQSVPPVEEQQSAPQVEQQAPTGEPRSERQAKVSNLSEYRPRRQKLENAGLDQHAAEEDRTQARSAQREEHNSRVGDASR